MRFSTLFKNKIKTPPGPHMNRQKRFREIFRFGEDIFSKFAKKCVSTWSLTTHTVNYFTLEKEKTNDKSSKNVVVYFKNCVSS